MGDRTNDLILKYLDDEHLALFSHRLNEWLIADLNQEADDSSDFTQSRAKALLRASGMVDDPTLHDFDRLLENKTAVRIALADLLEINGLAENEEVTALAATSGAAAESETSTAWLSLVVAAHAWKSGYPLYQLDPSSPPEEYSPAGQLLRRSATFLRRQVQRSATDRDKLGKKLAYDPQSTIAGAATLEALPDQPEIAPVPPHFRPPVPVNYAEHARDSIVVENEELNEQPAVTRNPEIVITEEDIVPGESQPVTMPPIQITSDQIPSPATTNNRLVTPTSSSGSGSNFNTAVQRRFGSKEPMRPVKLRIVVQEVQGGEGLYGLQVRVSCQGIKAFVAGTTNESGVFLCELPVRIHSGLTYDVDVTWPRDLGSETERKSLTLNVDRTEFTLPFYHRLTQ